jgi:RNase P subunit RPR2
MELKTVIAEEEISYRCCCPHCDEIIYSEYQDDWDIGTNVDYTVEITCTDCGGSFEVDLP